MIDFTSRITLTPKHAQGLNAIYSHPQPIVFLGGAAGGGKSRLLAHAAIHFVLYHYMQGLRNIPVLLTSWQLNLLIKRFQPHFERYYDLGRFVSTGSTPGFKFRNHSLGQIYFGHLQDINQYRGWNVAANFVDEFTELPPMVGEDSILPLLQIPIRSDLPVKSRPLVMASNWDGPSYHAARTLFWETGERETQAHRDLVDQLKISPERIRPVLFTIEDNPIAAVRDNYRQQLEGLSEHKKQSRLYGIPTHPQGVMFPFADKAITDLSEVYDKGRPSHFQTIVGVDWGINAPFCALIGDIDHETKTVYVHTEIYERDCPSPLQAQLILDKLDTGKTVEHFVTDPAMWNSTARSATTGIRGTSPIQDYVAVFEQDKLGFYGGRRVVSITAGTNARVPGWAWLQRMMHPKVTGWKLKISRTCRKLIGEIEAAIYDNSNQFVYSEDLHKSCSDHALDALRYLCMVVYPFAVTEAAPADQARAPAESLPPVVPSRNTITV